MADIGGLSARSALPPFSERPAMFGLMRSRNLGPPVVVHPNASTRYLPGRVEDRILRCKEPARARAPGVESRRPSEVLRR